MRSAIIIALTLAFLSLQGGVAHAQPGKPQSHQVFFHPALGNPLWSSAPTDSTNCKLNDSVPLLRCSAALRDDVLYIRIMGGDLADVGPTMELIVSGKDFEARLDLPQVGREPLRVEPTDQLLILDRRDFTEGIVVNGFLNFRGTVVDNPEGMNDWDAKQDWVESRYVVRGAFRVVISDRIAGLEND